VPPHSRRLSHRRKEIAALKRAFRAASYTSGGQRVDLLFGRLDAGHQGALNIVEFAAAVRRHARKVSDVLPPSELECLFTEIDRNGDGWVDADEWAYFLRPQPPGQRTGSARGSRVLPPRAAASTSALELETTLGDEGQLEHASIGAVEPPLERLYWKYAAELPGRRKRQGVNCAGFVHFCRDVGILRWHDIGEPLIHPPSVVSKQIFAFIAGGSSEPGGLVAGEFLSFSQFCAAEIGPVAHDYQWPLLFETRGGLVDRDGRKRSGSGCERAPCNRATAGRENPFHGCHNGG
jgi:hypothetical protein